MLLLYATDLIFSTKVAAEARAQGAALAVVRGEEALRAKLGEAPSLVIVDLDAEGALGAVAAARAAATRVLAFVSHLRADQAAAARAAGADEVLARSAFVVRLPAIVQAAAGGGAP